MASIGGASTGTPKRTSQYPNILLLDGGISTHLEQKLTSSTHGDNNQGQSQTSPFSHRELWSSYLLLTPKGREEILYGHLDFLEAGCDVISTLTYQLSHHLCEMTQQEPSNHSGKDDEEEATAIDTDIRKGTSSTATGTNHDDHGPSCTTVLPWTEATVNRYLRMACRIAQESLRLQSSTTRQGSPKRDRYIMASIGSYGGALADGSEYTGLYGDLSFEDLKAFHQKRLQVFMDVNMDNDVDVDESKEISMNCDIGDLTLSLDTPSCVSIITFETIPCRFEVEAILSVLKEHRNRVTGSDPIGRKKQIWLCLSCRDGDTLNDGTPIQGILDILDDHDPDSNLVQGIGVNCVALKFVQNLVEKIVMHELDCGTNRTVIFYPNSGEEWDAAKEQWCEGTGCTEAGEFADTLLTCIRSVHRLCKLHNRSALDSPMPLAVGGCCRTTPETIAALRCIIDDHI